jgi:hypothetical protein
MPRYFFDTKPRPFTVVSLTGLAKDAESQVNSALAACRIGETSLHKPT